jgi:hypothetical protein
VLQSLLRDRDLAAALESAHEVLAPGGVLGLDLVPDVPQWKEYTDRVQLRGHGPRGTHFTLIESVRQDPRRRLTTFIQEYRVRKGRTITTHSFTLTFRTVPVRTMARRLASAGFRVKAVLGDYRGRPWDERADVWIILAEKV